MGNIILENCKHKRRWTSFVYVWENYILNFWLSYNFTAFSKVNGKVGDHGFCNQQQVKATFCIHCGSGFSDSIAVLIVESENDPNGNYHLQCVPPQWMCFDSMTGTYNTTSDTLEIGFIFSHTIHGGRYLMIIRERNCNQENQHILLKPCCKFLKLYFIGFSFQNVSNTFLLFIYYSL